MAIKYSAEQNRLLAVRQGGVLAVANAGTGKTTTTSELYVDVYLAEENRMFPSWHGHVSGDMQRRLLRQFLCVTFTTKAAGEIDERIKSRFKARGIPLPTSPDGRPYRLARTLDSIIQSWLKKPAVFNAWMDAEPDMQQRISEVLEDLPRNIGEALASKNASNPALAFSWAWTWIGANGVDSMLLDLILRQWKQDPLPECNLTVWAEEFDEFILNMEWDGGRMLPNDFLESKLAIWNKHQAHLAHLEHSLTTNQIPHGCRIEEVEGDVERWKDLIRLKDEFISINELARARGYHPIYSTDRLPASTVEVQLSRSEKLEGYGDFMAISKAFHKIKVHFLLREFGDQTNAFVRACEMHPELLERTMEYPRMLRPKNVFWDEAQDNSDFQHRILKLFYGSKVPFLSVAVGDPKQQIYSWRGASPRGFLEMIERKRKTQPDNLLSLTVSFRSAQKIVAFGNEIIQTLPSYADSVIPSSTIYTEPGRIEVSPPIQTEEEEAEWVWSRIQMFLAKTSNTIMVLARKDVSTHPLYSLAKKSPDFGKRLQFLTIHKSKGLEADIVFVLGMAATLLPDIRSNEDEEINLFYVACTRAKLHLFLCGLVCVRKFDQHGLPKDEQVGPSPFFHKLPTLQGLCIEAGWPQKLLLSGVEKHDQEVAVMMARSSKKRTALIAERKTLFPIVEIADDERDGITDYGATQPDSDVAAMAPMQMKNSSPRLTVSQTIMDRVRHKLVEGYRVRGRLPSLNTDEFSVAVRCGWAVKAPNSRIWEPSSKIKQMVDSPILDSQ